MGTETCTAKLNLAYLGNFYVNLVTAQTCHSLREEQGDRLVLGFHRFKVLPDIFDVAADYTCEG